MSQQESNDTDTSEKAGELDNHEAQAPEMAEESNRSAKLRHDAQMTRSDAAVYFRALVEGMASGSMVIRQDDREVTLTIADLVDVELRASDKGEKGKFSFEVTWRAPEPPPPRLEIVPGHSE